MKGCGRADPAQRQLSSEARSDAEGLRIFDAKSDPEFATELAAFMDGVFAERRERESEFYVAVRLDALARLTVPVMASLIGTLRRLRDHGGDLVVVTRREDMRAALDVTGLDRVFRVVEVVEDLDAPPSSGVQPLHRSIPWKKRSFARA